MLYRCVRTGTAEAMDIVYLKFFTLISAKKDYKTRQVESTES